MPNADNAREFIEQVSELWRKRCTFKGLLGLAIILNSFLVAVFPGACFVLSKTTLISSAKDYAIFFLWCAISLGLSNIFLICAWTYWRTLPIASHENLLILFAPHADAAASELVYKLYHALCEDIKSRGMQSILICRHLSENHKIRNHSDAHSLLVHTGARLVIFGTVAKGKIKGDDIEGFRTISFTLRHRNLAADEKAPVAQDLAAALAYRAFCVNSKNSFIESELVVRNISEVSCFFLGLSLTLDGKRDKALSLLEALLLDVQKKSADMANDPQLVIFSKAIKSCLSVVLQTSFSEIYQKSLIDHITQREHDPQARECDAVLNKLLALDKRTSSYYLARAIIRFHFGDIDGAYAAAGHAKRVAPFNNAACHLSLAFLHLWTHNYGSAFMEYMRAGKCTDCNVETVTSVLLFLSSVWRLYPDRKELLFALSFVNDQFFDQKIALSDYRAFLTSEPNAELRRFTTFSERRVKRIEEAGNASQAE